jgi:hypothetical protein
MATASTHAEIAARLARQVERHGCGLSCDLCHDDGTDLETCLAPPARTVVARSARPRAVAVLTIENVFWAELSCY